MKPFRIWRGNVSLNDICCSIRGLKLTECNLNEVFHQLFHYKKMNCMLHESILHRIDYIKSINLLSI